MRHVLEQRGETVPPSGLTPQDVFYRHVSRIDHVLEALQLHESEVLGADVSPADVVSTVSTVNAIFCVRDLCANNRQGKQPARACSDDDLTC